MPMNVCRVVAHRGDSEAARENTLDAFRAAIEVGVEVIELDIRTTADGVSIVLHDETTLRLWGRPGAVAQQTLAQVKDLGVGDHLRIPTLAETIDLVATAEPARGSTRPVVLVDTVDADDAETAWHELARHPRVGDGTVTIEWCGDAAAMARIRQLDPEATVAHNHLGGDLDLELLRRQRPATINVEWILLTPELVEQVHGLGLRLATWTVDSAEQMSWLLDLGVDQITTNRPRTLRPLVPVNTGENLMVNQHSPLALAWADAETLAARTGLPLERARWVHVARQVAEWTIQHTRTAALGPVTAKKHAADVVTAVDVAVEERVRALITAAFPDHLVVGEELGGSSEPGRPTWYLDPVDGTTNLANHLPWTSMSLALAIDDEPVVAVVAQPWSGEIFLAVRGLGAVRNGVPLQLGAVRSLEGRALLTELAAHEPWPGMQAFMASLAEAHVTTRIMGSGTLTMTRIADGGGIAGLVHEFHAIDHLAGVLIAAEAGARVVNSDGHDSLFPSGGGMLVAAPGAAEKLWPLWERALAGSTPETAG
ncbi:inositol monophosphatase family protein [Aestuariimicrobium soli]|uniref:inositol monophosphatase family protein n=1 Tax=Aestuariimicrobium soli TaxID=2035834 RepID=UPI003EB7E29A